MKEMFRRRHLPHWDMPGATYFVTACLADSIPAQGLLNLRNFEKQLLASRPKDHSLDWRELVWKKVFIEREKLLDHDPAVRHLERPELAKIVADALRHFNGERYELIAWVIMPSHFHWLFRPLESWAATLPPERSARQAIMHSIKSFTAHHCNAILGRSGCFWQQESFDHCVRDDAELERIFDYIEHNPVKAGLCNRREEWPYSSAYGRLVR